MSAAKAARIADRSAEVRATGHRMLLVAAPGSDPGPGEAPGSVASAMLADRAFENRLQGGLEERFCEISLRKTEERRFRFGDRSLRGGAKLCPSLEPARPLAPGPGPRRTRTRPPCRSRPTPLPGGGLGGRGRLRPNLPTKTLPTKIA